MFKKFLSVLLILFILVFNIDAQNKEAQAILPLAIPVGLAYVATAMVAAGAVGYFTKDQNGVWGGNLYDAAKRSYDNMETNMKSALDSALATKTFIAMSLIPGLWSYLHNDFTTNKTTIPFSNSLVLNSIFKSNYQLYSSDSTNWRTWYLKDPNKYGYLMTFYNSAKTYNDPCTISCINQTCGLTANEVTMITTALQQLSATCVTRNGMSGFNGYVDMYGPYVFSSATGAGLVSGSINPTYQINDGDESRPINPPSDPTVLSQATPSTTYVDRSGTNTTPIPSQTVQDTDTLNDNNLADQAAAAAAAAIAAALAAGLSQAAANAAGVAASNAIYQGLTAAQAAAAGAAAAAAYVTAQTGALTTDIANTKAGDSLDFSKLKFAANLFTNKFPFSLPWDLKNMVTTFGSGSTDAPVIPIMINGLDASIDLSRFNSLAAAVRVMELFAFGVALLFGTRKLLGGDS